MFDDFFDTPEVDLLTIMVETHELKEEAKNLTDGRLVDIIINRSHHIEVDEETDHIIGKYFTRGTLTSYERDKLENCFALLEGKHCIGDDGKIYMVYMK